MQKEKKKNQTGIDLRRFWTRLWRLVAPSHRQIIGLLFLTIAIELISLVGPYMLKLVIDKITHFDVTQVGAVAGLVVIMFGVNQVVSVADYFRDRRIFAVLVDVISYLANNAHKKMVFLSLGYHEKESTGSKIIKISRGIDKIDNLFGNFFWEVAPTIFQVIFTAITLFVIDWRFGVIILVFVPAFVFLTVRVNKMVFPFRKQRFDDQEVASGMMAQSIININTVKSFVQEWREYRQFSQATENIGTSILNEYKKILRYNLLRNLIIDLGRGLVLMFGIYLVMHEQITLGSLVFVFTISEKGLISLFRISRLYDRIMESSEAVERLYLLSTEESEIESNPDGFKPKKIEGQIEFKDLSFYYKDSKNSAISHASFQINSNCVTALVGPSGGGKTTVVRMLYRHYDPSDGQILLDGKDLREYDLYAFRKFMAIVPQEVDIFDTSVKENIAYAKPGASQEEIEAAARIANAEEFILQLNAGYDTKVGERGIKLSGGQRQRIGIARAILANPKILIFDEATSNLDSQSERLIQDAMDKISKNRTVIMIAHRLSTIRKADKIIVLEKGQVIESGSHHELAKSDGGLYQKLLQLQQMGEVD
ncbi:MAG: ABC transporter ATP-binding protein [Parcubacteria group bacterium]|jgi:ABC-type multidrug transport system fused ATPase/permease subunit